MPSARITNHSLKLKWSEGRIIRLDAEGRWGSFRDDENFYRRTMAGEVVLRQGRGYADCSSEQAEDLHQKILHFLKKVGGAADNPSFPITFYGEQGKHSIFMERVQQALQWTSERYAEEMTRFQNAYPETIEILPPDRYQDLVLLPALGCPNNQCTFCAFYQGQRFRVLNKEAFVEHITRVKALFGKALNGKKGLFLGAASALSMPQKKILECLQMVNDVFGKFPHGIAAFHDADHSPQRKPEDYDALADKGLGHVTIGLETGDPELRKSFHKSADISHLLKVVRDQKSAGIRCAITVLIGVGAQKIEVHQTATTQVVEAMQLDKNDLVYLSPLEGTSGAADSDAEMELFRQSLSLVTAAQISPYLITKFRYFA
ncbi:MAG: radical SAM protein [SAR324 cluster bacterium]|nr:radical SAM protein [SAR324 cluster bacterium]